MFTLIPKFPNRFEVYTKKGSIIKYEANLQGLYILSKVTKMGEKGTKSAKLEQTCSQITSDKSENPGVREMNRPTKVNRIEVFTPRKADRTKAARKLYHDLGAPGDLEFQHLFSSNRIRDYPVTVEDAKLAEKALARTLQC